MTDDNLDDVQPQKIQKAKEMRKYMGISKPLDFGGYCPCCDTVWASPGKCKCDMTKGQYGKLNTEPTKYSKEVIEKYDDNNLITVEMVEIKNEREELLIKLWWNAAIEAALDKIDDSELYCAVARLKK